MVARDDGRDGILHRALGLLQSPGVVSLNPDAAERRDAGLADPGDAARGCCDVGGTGSARSGRGCRIGENRRAAENGLSHRWLVRWWQAMRGRMWGAKA